MTDMIARVYALRDLVNLAAQQAESLARDVPAREDDDAQKYAEWAARDLRRAVTEFDNCATALEARAAQETSL